MDFGRWLFAAIGGGAVLTIWGLLAWVLLPLHRRFFRRFHGEEEDRLRELLRQAPAPGIYLVPGCQERRCADREKQKAIDAARKSRLEEGPIAFLSLCPRGVAGGQEASPRQMALGFLLQTLCAALAFGLLELTGAGGFGARFGATLLTGALIGLAGHAPAWIWLRFPRGHTLAQIADLAIGWSLLGLWLAWMGE